MEVCEVVDFPLSEVDTSSCYLCASVAGLEETLLLSRPKDAKILDPSLSFSVTEGKGCFNVEISTDHPAFYVVPDAGDIKGTFSDCLFTLNGKRTVTFNLREEVTLSEFVSKLRVYDLYSSYSGV